MSRPPSSLGRVLAWGALGALTATTLAVSRLLSIQVGWGRELLGGLATLVAVLVGMGLARRWEPPVAPPPDATASPGQSEPPDVAELTPRERRILLLLDAGLTNKELATRLGVSENTVKTHLANLYQKLGVGRRTAALSLARRRGWLPTVSSGNHPFG